MAELPERLDDYSDSPQVSQIRKWVDGTDHDTFAFGSGFALALLATIDTLAKENYWLWNAGQRVCNQEPDAVVHMGRILAACRRPDGE